MGAEVAAELAPEQSCALQHRLRYHLKGASGQLQVGAAEADEAQNDVSSKVVAKAAKARCRRGR